MTKNLFNRITVSLIVVGLFLISCFVYKIFFLSTQDFLDYPYRDSSYSSNGELRSGNFLFMLPMGWYINGYPTRVGDKILVGTISYVLDKKNFGEEGTIFVNFLEEQTSQDLKTWFEADIGRPKGILREVNIVGVRAISQYTQFLVPTDNGVSLRTSREYYFKVGDKIREFRAYTVSGQEGERLLAIFDESILNLKLVRE